MISTYNVNLALKNNVETALSALARRGERRGLPELKWTWGKARTQSYFVSNDKVAAPGARIVRRVNEGYMAEFDTIELHLPVDLPKLGGWRFVATLQRLDDSNIVYAVPGEIVPECFRERAAWCTHCNTDRRRTETFVVAHDNGDYAQVGSSCIRDFLGNEAANNIAAYASLLSLVPGTIQACESDLSPGTSTCSMLLPYLQDVAAAVRMVGWVSRKMSRDSDAASTASLVSSVRAGSTASPYTVTDQDNETAAFACEWAEQLPDEIVGYDAGGFLHNIRTIARNGFVDSRTSGMAAAIITAYQRAVGDRARQARAAASVHVGTVGVRETFFDLTLDSVNGYATDYGYTTVLTFANTNGALVVWKASNTEISRADVGKRFDVTASVKSHGEYKGVLQTYITRAKVTPV